MAALIKRRDLPELLAHLVDRSMVHFDERTGRYRMNESVRDFARELADELGEAETEMQRFFRHMLNFSAEAREKLMGKSDREAHNQINAELDNIRAALDWGLKARGMGTLTLQLAANLGGYWQIEHVDEGFRWLAAAMDKAEDPKDEVLAWAEYYLARVKVMSGRMDQIQELLDSSVRRMKEIGDTRGLCLAFHSLGWPHYRNGDLARLKEVEMAALEIAKEHGYDEYTMGPLTGLGEAARLEGNFELALGYYEEALQIQEESEAWAASKPIILVNIASTALEMKDLEKSEKFFRLTVEASLPFSGADTTYGTAAGLEGLGFVALARGDFRKGGRLVGYAIHAMERAGRINDPADDALFNQVVRKATDEFGSDFLESLEAGRSLTQAQALQLADL